MNEKEFIVVIELGSSAIRGIAGRHLSDGSVKVERIVQIPKNDIVRRGVIYNLEKATNALKKIRETFEEELQVSVQKAYVGIQGQSVYTIKNFVRQNFADDHEVTSIDIEELLNRNAATNYGDYTIQSVITQEYLLDSGETDDPCGIQTHMIEGRFNNVVARTKLYDNIVRCMGNANLQLAGVILSPLALAENLLSDQERRSGCALVDIGAQTTTVQVYKGGVLRYLATIPLGSNSITRDIASAREIEEADAEALKIAHGVAIIDITKEESKAELPIAGERTYRLSLLERVCEARAEEILRNVEECIERSEVSELLTSGVVFTGGGAQLPGLTKAFTTHFPQFAKAHIARQLITSDELQMCGRGLQGGNYNTLVSLLSKADDVCTCEKEEPKVEQSEQTSFLGDNGEVKEPEEEEPVVEPLVDPDDDDEEDKKPQESFGSKVKSLWSKLVQSTTDALSEN